MKRIKENFYAAHNEGSILYYLKQNLKSLQLDLSVASSGCYFYLFISKNFYSRKYLKSTSFFNFSKASVVACLSKGKSLVLPKIFGKNSVCKRPNTKLASVTVKGPPI